MMRWPQRRAMAGRGSRHPSGASPRRAAGERAMFDSHKQIVAGRAGPLTPAAPAVKGTYLPNRNIHLFDRFAVVIKYYKAVVAVFLLVVAGWMYQTYTTTPMYRAQARLQIEEEHTAQTDFKEP